MPKQKHKTPLKLGTKSNTYRPGSKLSPKKEPWNWEFYVLPISIQGNGAIAEYLQEIGDPLEFKRNMKLPGQEGNQPVYAVNKSVMDKLFGSEGLSGHYKAYVRYAEGAAIRKYRTQEQIEASKERRAKKAMETTQGVVTAPAP